MVVFQRLHSVTRCHFRGRFKGGSRLIVLLCISAQRLLVIVRDIFQTRCPSDAQPAGNSLLKASAPDMHRRKLGRTSSLRSTTQSGNCRAKPRNPGKLEMASERFSLRLRGPRSNPVENISRHAGEEGRRRLSGPPVVCRVFSSFPAKQTAQKPFPFVTGTLTCNKQLRWPLLASHCVRLSGEREGAFVRGTIALPHLSF